MMVLSVYTIWLHLKILVICLKIMIANFKLWRFDMTFQMTKLFELAATLCADVLSHRSFQNATASSVEDFARKLKESKSDSTQNRMNPSYSECVSLWDTVAAKNDFHISKIKYTLRHPFLICFNINILDLKYIK